MLKDYIRSRPIPQRLADRLAREMAKPALTPRQFDVLALRANGLSVQEAADVLHLSYWTVCDHSKAAVAAMGAKSIPHAIALALVRGVLPGDFVEDPR